MARRSWRSIFAVVSLAACTRSVDFHEQLAGYERQGAVEITRARACADELVALSELHPAQASRAVAEMAAEPAAAPDRTPGEIARGVQELDAARTTIARAAVDGPVALERVVSAAARAHQLQVRLCQARDVAFTLAGMEPPAVAPMVARKGAPAP
jgi:hypothetical protein